MSDQNALKLGVIGVGRVGAALGAAFRDSDLEIVGVSGASRASRQRATTMLPGVPVVSAADVIESSTLVLLCVPDDSLADLAAVGEWRPGQIVAHVSGRHGLRVLDPVVNRGANPLALHPAMTFTGTAQDLPRLQGCCFGVTAPEDTWPLAQALVRRIGGDPVPIAESDRPLYHAALAHGSNHLVTLVAQARDVLGPLGVADPGRFLEPLLTAALDNALRRGDDALTGPIARGDAETVATHVDALGRSAPTPDILATYRALAIATTDRAEASGRLDTPVANSLRGTLRDGMDADARG